MLENTKTNNTNLIFGTEYSLTKVRKNSITKAIFTIVLLFFCLFSSATAQTWMALEQSPLNLRYEIPYNWYVGGYMTSRSCNCTSGTINTAPSRDLNMVIFFSDDFDVDSLKKQDVWGYRFAAPSVIDTLETPHFAYNVEHSRWENDADIMVIRLSTQVNGKSYVIYFWGSDDVLNNMDETIMHIVNSISPI